MKSKFLFILLFVPIIGFGKNFVIDKNTCIVVNPDSTSSIVVTFASTELQYFIEKVTGIRVPIVKETETVLHNCIYVGAQALPSSKEQTYLPWQEQEYVVDVSADRIILTGNDTNDKNILTGRDNTGIVPETDRIQIHYQQATGDQAVPQVLTLPSVYDAQGTCYAVYDFIERFLGVRFYGPHPENIYIPHTQKIKISPQLIRRSPALKYRQGTYSFDWPMMKEQYLNASPEMQQLFVRRMRMGGRRYAANHAFTGYQDRFLKKNPKRPELFESYHPEYFAKGRDGGASERQFCYTNPGFIKQVAKDAIRYFQGEGVIAEQIALGDYFGVVPLDNANWCTCEECQKLLALDKDNIIGTHFNCGTATHYMWNFINQVAKEVKKEIPNKKISALAYHVYAYLPQDIHLEENIAVAPCLHPRNYWAPGMERNEMKFYKAWIKESKKTGRDIFLWNYLCFPTERGLLIGKYNVFPGFNIHKTGELLKMYAEDGVKGIFLCGIGEQLDFYITMKLMDDPSLSINTLVDEFFTFYFGQASGPMKAFYEKIESVYSSPKNYPEEIQTQDAQFHQTEEIAWKYLGTKPVMDELANWIEKANSTVKNEDERVRVESWTKGIWKYMQEGYEHYYKAQKE